MRRDMSPAGLHKRLMTRGSREYRTDMKRRAAWIAGIVVLAGVVAALTLGGSRRDAGAAKYETVKVERGRIIARVTASGTLSALVTVQGGAQVSGRIQDLYVDFNSPVRRGQILAKIDPQFFKAAVEQAKANLAAAEGNLAKARAQAVDAHRQYQRAKTLAEQGQLVSQSDLDTADANAQSADAQIQAMEGAVAQARASLYQADVNLGYTTITSSIDGTVISRNVDVGQTVAASLQAPTLFTIAQDLKKMQVDTNVSEADVAPGPQRPHRARRTVWVLRHGEPEPISIRTGLSDGSVTEVAEGDLREGDPLITEAITPGNNVPPAFRRPL